jgi:hypothetical protein
VNITELPAHIVVDPAEIVTLHWLRIDMFPEINNTAAIRIILLTRIALLIFQKSEKKLPGISPLK